jgi:hypothetical protein
MSLLAKPITHVSVGPRRDHVGLGPSGEKTVVVACLFKELAIYGLGAKRAVRTSPSLV